MRDFLGLRHPFFRPLWRRVAVTGVCLIWALFEFAGGSPFWGMLTGALGAYAGWVFFLAPDPAPEDRAPQDDDGKDGKT